MQHDVSRKRALLPSPAMVVAIIALIVALGGIRLRGKKSVESPQLGRLEAAEAEGGDHRQDRQQRRQRAPTSPTGR